MKKKMDLDFTWVVLGEQNSSILFLEIFPGQFVTLSLSLEFRKAEGTCLERCQKVDVPLKTNTN